jgi:hypothetical protein
MQVYRLSTLFSETTTVQVTKDLLVPGTYICSSKFEDSKPLSSVQTDTI